MQVSVVTGAAGFLGQALVHRLLADGDNVRALVLPSDPTARDLRALAADSNALTVVEGDITNADSLNAAFDGADRIFHTAALVHAWAPRETFERVNVFGTRNIAELSLAHGIGRLIAVSTSDVFGLPRGDEVFTERSQQGYWGEPYADSKIDAERWLWRLQRESGLPVTVIYPGWIYGPGDRAFFPGLAKAIRWGQMIFWAHGIRLPFAYVDNVVDAVVMAANSPRAVGNGYIVFDTNNGPTMEELCDMIAVAIDAKPPRRHIPYGLAHGAAQALQSIWKSLRLKSAPPLLSVDVKAFGMQWHLSNEKVRRELGWSPRVDIETGMRNALADLRARLASI